MSAAAGALARWRLAARLARREVRRRPGRTLLVMLLVTMPVLAMTLGSVVARTNSETFEETWGRRNGSADAVVNLYGADRPSGGQPGRDELAARVKAVDDALPAGAGIERYVAVDGPMLRGPSEQRWVRFTDQRLDGPIGKGVLQLVEGREPESAGELALDPGTADALDVGVGDTLDLTSPKGSWTVSGFIRLSDRFGDGLVVFADFDWNRAAVASTRVVTLVDLPDGQSSADRRQTLQQLNSIATAGNGDINGRDGEWWMSTLEPLRVRTLVWGWVAGVLALCVVGIVIAAAFATSARRQLVVLGQLSSNGAAPGLLRRMLALQGFWTGLIGSAFGVVVALLALAPGRTLLEYIVAHRLSAYDVSAPDLLIIVATGTLAATIAALVPAISSAKVPVMAALAGRRPLGVVPRRLVPIGIGLFGLGLVLLAAATAGLATSDGGPADLLALTAVLGGLAVLAGVCCVTPLVASAIGRLGGRMTGSWRLTARSIARTRVRSAGVITAVAATSAFAIMGVTALASAQQRQHDTETLAGAQDPVYLPADTVILASNRFRVYDQGATIDGPSQLALPVPTEVVDEARSMIGITDAGSGRQLVRRAATWDPAPMTPDPTGSIEFGVLTTGSITVADDAVLEMVGLSATDRARLEEVGAMALTRSTPQFAPALGDIGLVDDGTDGTMATGIIDIEGVGRRTLHAATTTQPFSTMGGTVPWPLLITPEAAAGLGLHIVDDGVILRSGRALSDSELQSLQRLQENQPGFNMIFDQPEGAGDLTAESSDEWFEQTSVSLPRWVPTQNHATDKQLALGIAALLLTLFIVAVGLALSAAESRDERYVLTAVGARPSTVRRMTAQTALLLAGTGTLIAVPTGLLPLLVVLRSTGSDTTSGTRMTLPWVLLLGIVVGVPAVAGALMWAGSAIGQRARPLRLSAAQMD